MNILITGGTGFVGHFLASTLLAEKNKIFVTGRERNIPKGTIFCDTYLTGLNWTALSKENIDVVYHQAANNDTQSLDETDMIKANFDAPCYLFNSLYRFGCRKFIYASSTAVYGNSPAPYVEDETIVNPLTIYGKSKAMFDEFAMNFAKERPNSSVIGLRYCNVYGEGEQHKGKRASMIYQMLDRFLTSQSWSSMVGPNYCSPSLFEFGEQSRDWIYIKDVVKANLLALKYNVSNIYNCASGVATSFNRLVEIMNQIKFGDKKHEWVVNYIKNPIEETYQNNTCCNIDKIQKELGFEVDYPIERGIRELFESLSCYRPTMKL
jgi:ADP-L-glycero-D-manno-heptose 6-epimerase